MASAQAIDLSNWNSKAGTAFDIAGAKAKIPNLVLVMVRVTQGLGGPGTGSPDPTAAANIQAARDLGLDVGGYHFLDPNLNGRDQANYFLETADKLPGGVTWRFHASCDNETAGGQPPAKVAQVASNFMAELDRNRKHGYNSVYTFINFARDGYCAGLGEYLLWLANPASVAPHDPPPWQPEQFTWWQYGQRDGVDADGFMKGDRVAYEQFVQGFAPSLPHLGPYRHLTNPLHSLAEVAHQRGTTVESLLKISAAHYTAEDYRMAGQARTYRVPFYTNQP